MADGAWFNPRMSDSAQPVRAMGQGDLSIDALAYELANRAFRGPVLEHVRLNLTEHLNGDVDSQIELLFQKEWNSICSSIDVARAKGIQRELIDNLDRLSVNHFYVLFEKFFDVIVPAEAIPVGGAERHTRKRVLSWLEQIKDVRNPNAHPATDDLPIFDALSLADACVRVATLLQVSDALDAIAPIRRELLRRAADVEVSPGQSSPLMSSLPSRESMYDRFIGRGDELELLWAWFADDASHRWVLVGEGGKGKSSIAHQFGLGVARANPVDLAAVLWLSAKKRRFEDSEPVEIARPDFDDLDSALDRMLSDFGDSENSGKTVDVKRSVVLQLLNDFPSLLIVDDIDSIEELNEDVVEFFTYEAPRTRSKVLLTSRRMYPGMGRSSTRVLGLPEEDAKRYMQMTAERLGLGARPDLESSFAKIYEATEGSPLYMEDLLRLCRQLKVKESIDRWKQQRGDAARRYALQREVELLSDTARNCLSATCWARVPLSIAQMEAVLGIGEDEAVSAVQELESRFLVPAPEIVEGVPSYRAHRNLEVLVRQEMRADPSRHWIRDAVEGVVRVSVHESGVAEIYRQVTVRIRGSRFSEALELVEAELGNSPTSPDLLALRAEVLASHKPPRMTDARQDWNRAADLGLRRRESFLRWAIAEERAQDWERMFRAADLGLERASADDPSLLRNAGYAASRMGQALIRALDTESGQAWLERAEVLLRTALDQSKKQGTTDYDLGRIYRALIVNAQYLREGRSNGQVLYWCTRWLEDGQSPEAVQEARRQAPRFREVRDLLDSLRIEHGAAG